MTKLNGRRILITEATSRLGLAMAQALAGAAPRVAVTSRDLRGPTGRLRSSAVARSPWSSTSAMSPRYAPARSGTFDRLSGIDMLVNNAGIGMRTVNPRFLSEPPPFWRVSLDGFRDVLDT
jgi:NAD(P)-dependent dehydrogenase (short-subunit alcohol dehydrogenase family)